MDAHEIDFVEWSFKGVITGIIAIGAWLWNGLVNEMKELRTKHQDLKDNVIENYAKNEDIRLVFSKLDEVQKTTAAMANNIATLMERSSHNKGT